MHAGKKPQGWDDAQILQVFAAWSKAWGSDHRAIKASKTLETALNYAKTWPYSNKACKGLAYFLDSAKQN